MPTIRNIFWGIVVPILVILAAGYVGHWYGAENGCRKCDVGFPNLLTRGDLEETTLCWVPSYCPVKEEQGGT